MKVLLKLSSWIDILTERLGDISTWLTVLVIAVGFINVVVRYVGRTIQVSLTSNGIVEAQWYLYAVIFLLGFAYILKHGVNVRVDFFFTNFTPKQKALVDVIGHLLFLIPFCVLGIYVSINPVMISWGLLGDGSFGTWEMSPNSGGLPRAPLKSMVIIGFAALLLQTFSELVKKLAVLTGHVDYEAVEQEKAATADEATG